VYGSRVGWILARRIHIHIIIISSIRLHCSTSSMWPIAIDRIVRSVSQLVGRSLPEATVNPAKMAEVIEMPFGMWT